MVAYVHLQLKLIVLNKNRALAGCILYCITLQKLHNRNTAKPETTLQMAKTNVTKGKPQRKYYIINHQIDLPLARKKFGDTKYRKLEATLKRFRTLVIWTSISIIRSSDNPIYLYVEGSITWTPPSVNPTAIWLGLSGFAAMASG